MKRIVAIVGVLCCTTWAFAEDKEVEFCKDTLSAGMYMQTVENTCGFDDVVSNNFVSIYDTKKCREIVHQQIVDDYAKQVTEGLYSEYEEYGHEKFCAMYSVDYKKFKKGFSEIK